MNHENQVKVRMKRVGNFMLQAKDWELRNQLSSLSLYLIETQEVVLMERSSVHFFFISDHMVSTLPFPVSLGASELNDFKTSD